MSTVTKLDTRELDRIMRQSGLKARQVVKRFAFKVEGYAKMNAKVATGAMKNSIYTVADGYNGYASAAAQARSKNSEIETVPIPTPATKDIAHVGPCVDYGVFVEFGTSKMAAQPYLIPAVEQASTEFNNGKSWEEVVK